MNIEQELSRRIKTKVLVNEPMALHTSWQVGGPADYYLSPDSVDELVEIIKFTASNNVPLFIMGNGTNLLVRDGGIRGVVVNIGEAFSYIKPTSGGLVAGAGTSMTLLARTSASYGFGGLEFAVGIPGSLGGAVIMNAGAFGGYIGERVQSVNLINLAGEISTLTDDELQFGYRTSNLVGKGIIYEINLNLKKGEKTESEKMMRYFLAERHRRHPNLPSAGSVFRNLPDQPAGRIVESAGGKGMRIGGAEVSEQHANFIVNIGDATASDILALIVAVQKLVKDKFAIDLKPEVKIVGEER
ncbi:MAG: UDP-N-acetylmuramate dehydrogenase [Bacillota bacterium]|nr:UDP-N-acetylmuramate dehydrogenase [Bacillota bacterium]